MSLETALFSLDNQPDILDYRFSDGTPVWLNLRFMLRLKHMEGLKKSSGSGSPAVATGGRKALLKYLLFTWRHRPPVWRKSPDILSIANYEGNPDMPNRMTVFLHELPEFNRAELLYSPRWLQFSGLKDTWSFDYFHMKAWLLSKWKKDQDTQFGATLSALMEKVRVAMQPWLQDRDLEVLANQLKSINPLTIHYRRLLGDWLKKARPRFILCSEGNNGDWRHAILFNLAHQLHIPTGEVQHGVFNVGMKYGDALAGNAEFAQFKSSHLFTFGAFHCTQTNLPATCIPLGHYHMEKAALKIKAREEVQTGPLRILFVAEGLPPSAVDNGLIRSVSAALSNFDQPFQLVVRLHPSERPDPKYAPLLAFEGTRYSESRTEGIHQLIADSDLVISHASTVVFEAMYFGKPVFVLDDANTAQYIPAGIGTRFTDATSLLNLLNAPDKSISERTDYWAAGTVSDNFRIFMQSLNKENPPSE